MKQKESCHTVMHRNLPFIVVTAAFLTLMINVSVGTAEFSARTQEALGPRFSDAPRLHEGPRHPLRRDGMDATSALRYWNEVVIDASGLDHTPVAAGEVRVFGEQFGPARASRAMAIVHIAIFDAVNAIEGHYKGYTELLPVPADTSIHAAIAQAAHDTLIALFPSQMQRFNELLAEDLGKIADGHKKASGIQLGQNAAAAILALRASDGSQHSEPRVGIDFITSDEPGKWRQDPISIIPLAVGAYWGAVKPFVLTSADQFRAPVPPSLDSPEYTMAFAEVKAIGGDGVVTPTVRNADQTQIGIYWAYDGMPSLCAPPRLYNQIVAQIADERHSNVLEFARLLALVNIAMADAGIAVWESKYHYQFWRPVTAIREADDGAGPTGVGDGNSGTFGDLKFTPMGAPASNLHGPYFTPPFPAYPSGHAGFGGAVFQTLRNFYRTDRIAFTFVSDEFNGETLDNNGALRPLVPRSFSSLSQAEEENGQSRIYLGIHWIFDKTEGIKQGRHVADHVFKYALVPLRERRDGQDEH
jgi:hypothetical protein